MWICMIVLVQGCVRNCTVFSVEHVLLITVFFFSLSSKIHEVKLALYDQQ